MGTMTTDPRTEVVLPVSQDPEPLEPTVEARGYWEQVWRRFRRDRVAIGKFESRLVEHGFDQRREPFGMRPGSDLGNDSAIRRVRRILRRDPLGEHAAIARHQGGCGLVAAALDPQNDHFGIPHGGFH